MQKIPTLFVRDWDGDRSRVTREVTPGCEWVLEGIGVATRKYDGTCCMIRDGKLYKRHEVKPGNEPPENFWLVEVDEETGKTIGWLPVGDGPQDRWHREAFASKTLELFGKRNGTYELIGPKINGNPERASHHLLVEHARAEEVNAPRTYDDLYMWFDGRDIEGVVFHRLSVVARIPGMVKIKARDFGFRRPA